MNYIMRAMEIASAAHKAHIPEYYDHVVGVARRVRQDPRANDMHVATAYLINIGFMARVDTKTLILAGIPGDVVRAIHRLEYRGEEEFLVYLKRISEHPVTALVAHHHFMEHLGDLDPNHDDDITARFRRAAGELNEAVNMNTPRSG